MYNNIVRRLNILLSTNDFYLLLLFTRYKNIDVYQHFCRKATQLTMKRLCVVILKNQDKHKFLYTLFKQNLNCWSEKLMYYLLYITLLLKIVY